MTAQKHRRKGLQPSVIKETTSVRKLEIDSGILEEAKSYSKFVGISSIDETIEKALQYVFEDDTDWQKVKKQFISEKKETTSKKTVEV